MDCSATGSMVITIDFPTFITQVLAEVSYLVVCIPWSFYMAVESVA